MPNQANRQLNGRSYSLGDVLLGIAAISAIVAIIFLIAHFTAILPPTFMFFAFRCVLESVSMATLASGIYLKRVIEPRQQ